MEVTSKDGSTKNARLDTVGPAAGCIDDNTQAVDDAQAPKFGALGARLGIRSEERRVG